jgi:serine acetyltransferase
MLSEYQSQVDLNRPYVSSEFVRSAATSPKPKPKTVSFVRRWTAEGFGFETDDSGRPIWIGHMGGVVIGGDVEIGVHCSIAQGTTEPTRIHDHVKIDDRVFIAHNVCVGEKSFIIAGAEISGSVDVGRGSGSHRRSRSSRRCRSVTARSSVSAPS